ncbi:hypothetical protein [Immundisolibacter sp.]
MMVTTDPLKVNQYLAPFLSYLNTKGIKIDINDNFLNRVNEYENIFKDEEKASYHALNDVLYQMDNFIKTGKKEPLNKISLNKDKEVSYDTLFNSIDKPFLDEEAKEERIINNTLFKNDEEYLKKVKSKIPFLPKSYSDDDKLMVSRYITAREDEGEKISPLKAIEDLYIYGITPQIINEKAKKTIKDEEGYPPALELGYNKETAKQEWIHSMPQRKSFWDYIGFGEKKPYDDSIFSEAYNNLTGRLEDYKQTAKIINKNYGIMGMDTEGAAASYNSYNANARGDYNEYVKNMSDEEKKKFDYSLKKEMGKIWEANTDKKLQQTIKQSYTNKLIGDAFMGVLEGVAFTPAGLFLDPRELELQQSDAMQLAEIKPERKNDVKKYNELRGDLLGEAIRSTTQSLTFVATSAFASESIFGENLFSLASLEKATTKGAKVVDWFNRIGKGYITGIAVGTPSAFQEYISSPYYHNDEKTVLQKLGRGLHESINSPGMELLTETLFGEWAIAAKNAGILTPLKIAVNTLLGIGQEVAEEEISGWFDDWIRKPDNYQSVLMKFASGQFKNKDGNFDITKFREQFIIASSTLLSFGLFGGISRINQERYNMEWGKAAKDLIDVFKQELPFRLKENLIKKFGIVLDETDELNNEIQKGYIESSRGVNNYLNQLLAVYSSLDPKKKQVAEEEIEKNYPGLSPIKKALLVGWYQTDANDLNVSITAENIISLGDQLENAMINFNSITSKLIDEFFESNDNFGLNKDVENLVPQVKQIIIKNLPSMLGSYQSVFSELERVQGMDKKSLSKLTPFIKILYEQNKREEVKKLKNAAKGRSRIEEKNIKEKITDETERKNALKEINNNLEKEYKVIDAIAGNLGQISYSMYEMTKSANIKADFISETDKDILLKKYIGGSPKNKLQKRITALKNIAEESNPLYGKAYNMLPQAARELLKNRYGYYSYNDEIKELDNNIEKAEKEKKKRMYLDNKTAFFTNVMKIGASAFRDIYDDENKAGEFLSILSDYLDNNETRESASKALTDLLDESTAEAVAKIEDLLSKIDEEFNLYKDINNKSEKKKKDSAIVIGEKKETIVDKESGEKITSNDIQKMLALKMQWIVDFNNAFLTAKIENPDLTKEEFEKEYIKTHPKPNDTQEAEKEMELTDDKVKVDTQSVDKKTNLLKLFKFEDSKFIEFIDKFIVPYFVNIPIGNIEYGYKQLSKAEIENIHQATQELFKDLEEKDIETTAEKVYNLYMIISNFRGDLTDDVYFLMSPAIRSSLIYSFMNKLGNIDKKYLEAINQELPKSFLGKIYTKIIEIDAEHNTFDQRYKHIQYHYTDARSQNNTTLNKIISMIGFLNPLNLAIFPESRNNIETTILETIDTKIKDFKIEDRIKLMLALEDIPGFFNIGNELYDIIADKIFEGGLIVDYKDMVDILSKITGIIPVEVESIKDENGQEAVALWNGKEMQISKTFNGKSLNSIAKGKAALHEYTHVFFDILRNDELTLFIKGAFPYTERVKDFIKTKNPDYIKDEYRQDIDRIIQVLQPTMDLIEQNIFNIENPVKMIEEFTAYFMGNNVSVSSLMYLMKPLQDTNAKGASLFDAFFNFQFDAILKRLEKIPSVDAVFKDKNLAVEYAKYTTSFYKYKLRQIAKVTDAIRELRFASVIEDDDSVPNIKPTETSYAPKKLRDADILGIGGESLSVDHFDDTFGLDHFDEESIDPEHDFLRDKETMTAFVRSKMFRVIASIQGFPDALDIYEVARRITEEAFIDSFTVKPGDDPLVKERKAILNKALLASIPYKGMSKFNMPESQIREMTIRALFIFLKNTENKQLYGIESRVLTDEESGETVSKLKIVKRPATFRVEGVQRTSIRGNTILEEEFLPVIEKALGVKFQVAFISDYNYKKRNGEVVSLKIHNGLRAIRRKDPVTKSATGVLSKAFWENNIIYLLPFADKNTSPLLVFDPADKKAVENSLLKFYNVYSELFGNMPFDLSVPDQMGLAMSLTMRMIVEEIKYYHNPLDVLEKKNSTITKRNFREMMKRHTPAVQTGRPVYSNKLSKEIKQLGFVVDETTIPSETPDAQQPAYKYQKDENGNITEVFIKLAVLYGEGNKSPMWTNRHGKFRHDGATYGLKDKLGKLISLVYGSMNEGANKDYIIHKNIFGKHSEQYIDDDGQNGIGNAMAKSNVGILMMNSNEKNNLKGMGIPVWDAQGNVVDNLLQYKMVSYEDLLTGNVPAYYIPLSSLQRIGAAHSNKNETNGFQQSVNSSGLTQTNPAVTPTLNKIVHTFAKLLAGQFRDELMEDPIRESNPRITGHKKLFVGYVRNAIKSPQGHLQAAFSDMFSHLENEKDDLKIWEAIQPLMYHELIYDVLVDYLGSRLRDYVKMTHTGNMLTLHTDGGNLFPTRVKTIKENITNYMVVPKYDDKIYDYMKLDAKYRKLKYEVEYKIAKKESVSHLTPELRKYQDRLARIGDPFAEHKKKMISDDAYRAKIEEESNKLYARYLDDNGFLKRNTVVFDQKTADRLGIKVGDTVIPAILPTDSAMGLYSAIVIGVLPNDIISDSAIILPSEYVQLVGKDYDLDKIVTLTYDSRYLSHQDWKTLAKEIQVMQQNYLEKIIKICLKDNNAEVTDANIQKVFVDKGEGSLLAFVKELYGEKKANDYISPFSIEAFQLADNYYKKVGYVVVMRQLHQYLGNLNLKIKIPGIIDIDFGNSDLWFRNHIGMLKLTNDQVDYPNPMDKDFYNNDEKDVFYAMIGIKRDKATPSQRKAIRIIKEVIDSVTASFLNIPRFRGTFEGDYSRVQNTTNSIITSKGVSERLVEALKQQLVSAFENKKNNIEVTTDPKIKYPLEEMVEGVADELKSANFYPADVNEDIIKNLTRKTEFKIAIDFFRQNMTNLFGEDFIDAIIRIIDFGLVKLGGGARGFEIRNLITDETGREAIAKDKRFNKAETQYMLIFSRNLSLWSNLERKTLIDIFPYDENNKYMTEDRQEKYILLTKDADKAKGTKMKVISNIEEITFDDIIQKKIIVFDQGYALNDIVNHIESYAGQDLKTKLEKIKDTLAEFNKKKVLTRHESYRSRSLQRNLTNIENEQAILEGRNVDLSDVFLRTNQQFGLSQADQEIYELYASIYFAVTGKTELGFERLSDEENKIVVDREHIAAYPIRSTIIPRMLRVALDNPNYKIYKSNINTLVTDIKSGRIVQLNPKNQLLELKEKDENGKWQIINSVRNYKSDINIYNILLNEDNYGEQKNEQDNKIAERNRFAVDAAFNFSHHNTVSAQDRLGIAAEYINTLTEEQFARLPEVFTLMMGIPTTSAAAINLHGFNYSVANENLYRLMARYTPKLWREYLKQYSKYNNKDNIRYASVIEDTGDADHSIDVASILTSNNLAINQNISEFKKIAESNPDKAYDILLKLALDTDVRYEAARLNKNYKDILKDIKSDNLNWYNSILNLKGKEPRVAKKEVYTMIFRELKTLKDYVEKHKDKSHMENYLGLGRKTFSSIIRSFELKTYNRLYHNPKNPLFYMPDFVNKNPKKIKPIDVIDYTMSATPFAERETGLRAFGNLAVLDYNLIRTDELMYALRNDIVNHLSVRGKFIFGQLINKTTNPKGFKVKDTVNDRKEFESQVALYEQELNGVKELYVKKVNSSEAQVLIFNGDNKLIFQAKINLTTGEHLYEASNKIFDIKNNPNEGNENQAATRAFIASRFKWLKEDTPYHRFAFAAALQSKVIYHSSIPSIIESVTSYLDVMKELVQHPAYKLEIEQLSRRFKRYQHLLLVNTTEEKEIIETKNGKKVTIRKFSPVVFDREEFIAQYLELNPDKTYEDAVKITGFDTYYIPFFHNNLYSGYPRNIKGFNKDLIFIDRMLSDIHTTVNEVALMAYHYNALAMGENQHIINVVMRKSLEAVHPVRLAKPQTLQSIEFGSFITFFTFEESMEGNKYIKTHYGELKKRDSSKITIVQDGIEEEFDRAKIMAFRRDLESYQGVGYIENAAMVIDRKSGKKMVDKINYFIRDAAGVSILGLHYMPRSAVVNLVGSSLQALSEKPSYLFSFFGGNKKLQQSYRIENSEINEALKYISVLGSVTLDVMGEMISTEYSRYQEVESNDPNYKKFIKTLKLYKQLLDESPLETRYHKAVSQIMMRVKDINNQMKEIEEVEKTFAFARKDYNDLRREKEDLYKTLKYLRYNYRFTVEEIEEIEDPELKALISELNTANDIGIHIDLNPKTIKKLRKSYIYRKFTSLNYKWMRSIEEVVRPNVLAMAFDMVNKGNFADMTDERALNYAATFVRTTQGHFKWYQERLSKRGSLGAVMYLLHSFSLHAIDRIRRVISDANYTRLLFGLRAAGYITIDGEKVAMNPQKNLFNMFYVNMVLFNLSSKVFGLSFLMNPVMYPFFFTIKYLLDALDPDDNEATVKSLKFIILSWIQLMVGWGGAILPSIGLTAIGYQEGDWTLLLPRAWKDVYTPIGGTTAPEMVARSESEESKEMWQKIITKLTSFAGGRRPIDWRIIFDFIIPFRDDLEDLTYDNEAARREDYLKRKLERRSQYPELKKYYDEQGDIFEK